MEQFKLKEFRTLYSYFILRVPFVSEFIRQLLLELERLVIENRIKDTVDTAIADLNLPPSKVIDPILIEHPSDVLGLDDIELKSPYYDSLFNTTDNTPPIH